MDRKDRVLTAAYNKEDYEANQDLCKQGCDGNRGSGKSYSKCGVCGGSDSECLPPCCDSALDIENGQGDLSNVDGCVDPEPANWKSLNLQPNTPSNCWSRFVWNQNTACGFGVYQDACGKCGGDGSTCKGCDREPFSGRVKDLRGTGCTTKVTNFS